MQHRSPIEDPHDAPTVVANLSSFAVASASAMKPPSAPAFATRPSIPPFATLPHPSELTPVSGFRLRVTPEMVQQARAERAARWAEQARRRNVVIVATLWTFAAVASGALAFLATSSI